MVNLNKCRRGEKKKVTQMNWTRRTTRMKNKKLFYLFVSYMVVVTLTKPSQPYALILCTWFNHGLMLTTLNKMKSISNKNGFEE